MRTFFAAALLALLSHGAQACLQGPDASCHQESNVSVIDTTAGYPLVQWQHPTGTYVEGSPGHGYTLTIRNPSRARVLAVVSVDGLNVVSGKPADFAGAGYVLKPGQTVQVAGWRKSLRNVAEFYFTYPKDSYAARTGRPKNLGVIGVAFFEEMPQVTALPEMGADILESRSAGAAAEKSQALGTGHGRTITSRATTVEFERRSTQPDRIATIFYDTRAALMQRGVVPTQVDPNPFPAQSEFVPDPPGTR